jgi:hypothetical protein
MRSPPIPSASVPSAPVSALRLQARLLAKARRRLWLRHTPLLALAGVLTAAVAFVAWRRLQADGGALLALLRNQPLMVVVAGLALAWTLTRNARRRTLQSLARSWLTTAPLDTREVLAATRLAVAWRVMPPLLATLAVPLAAMAASGTDGSQTIALAGAGFAVGTLAGWRSGAHPNAAAPVTVPRLSAQSRATSNAAGLAALARWPFARLLADADPRRHAQLIAGVLLTLPMGMAPAVAVLIVLLAASLLAAHSLLQALLATIPDAAAWTRATPLPLGAFTQSLCLRSGVALAAIVAIASAALVLLGASPLAASAFTTLALAWSVTAIVHALASRHQAGRARKERIAIALAMLALLGTAWWLLPFALPLLWWRDLLLARRA